MKNVIDFSVCVLLVLASCGPTEKAADISTSTPITVNSATSPSAAIQTAMSEMPTNLPLVSTPEPTKFPPVEAERIIKEYISTNNNCRLPCFWGVVPGETSVAQAVKFFQPFGITKKLVISLNIGSSNIINEASLFEENGKVVGIEVSGEGLFHDNPSFEKSQKEFWSIWTPYLPVKVIAKYNNPETVWFYTFTNPEVADPNKPLSYSLWLFYEKEDFAIVYSGITTKAPSYNVCLGNGLEKDGFGNLSPYINILVHKTVRLQDIANDLGISAQKNVPLEENPNYPLDKLVQVFQSGTGCFKAPSNR